MEKRHKERKLLRYAWVQASLNCKPVQCKQREEHNRLALFLDPKNFFRITFFTPLIIHVKFVSVFDDCFTDYLSSQTDYTMLWIGVRRNGPAYLVETHHFDSFIQLCGACGHFLLW